MVNFKIYDVTDWATNSYNTHCLKPQEVHLAMKFGQLIDYNMRYIFRGKSYAKCCRKASRRTFYKKKSKLSISESIV